MRMERVGLTCALMLAASTAWGADAPAVTATEIKIGQNAPFSGPTSAYGQISTAEAAYFKMINDGGGRNTRPEAIRPIRSGPMATRRRWC